MIEKFWQNLAYTSSSGSQSETSRVEFLHTGYYTLKMATKRKTREIHLSDSARKRAKKEQDRQLSITRVTLKGQFVRWQDVKAAHGFKTQEEVAKYLLDW